jgi:uncharacterized membrane protein/glutaredoxin
MITVTLYSREGCQLCEQALRDLKSLEQGFPHRLVVVDVEQDTQLKKVLRSEVPVVQVGPYRLSTPFSLQELQMTLGAARDRERHIEMVEKSPALEEVRRYGAWTVADRFAYWFSSHYMAVFNLLVVAYLGLAFLPPVLMKFGAEAPANLIYRGFSLVCHQLAFRSIYLFGVQFYYPRAAAGVKGVKTLQQATGLNEGSDSTDLYAARVFVGNEVVGYKVALCQRDLGIYAGILSFGVLFSLTKRRLQAIPWYVWIILGILPIAVDGLSQLLSQPPLSFWPFRESTPVLRLLTGGLFGFFTAWFGYPMVEETMADTRRIISGRLQRLGLPSS